MGTGVSGGRRPVTVQPCSVVVAGPQTRPWQAPIPQRVCNFASAQEVHP
ncbi:hypothetical protein DEDE109153_18365 [Deinococcus deserti]